MAWRHRMAVGLAVFTIASAGSQLAAQVEAFFLLAPKLEVQSVALGSSGAVVDMPKRDWRVTPSKDGDLVATAEQRRREATIQVEVATLQQPLASSDVTELFGEIESERLKQLHPQATGFEVRMFRLGERRVAVVQFTRPGSAGAEQVRQYSYPDGAKLYRVTCISAVERFKRYEPIFAHVAASFRGPGQS